VGIGLVLWTIWIAYDLPRRHVARHWDVAWAGFDVMMAALLLVTAYGAARRAVWLPRPCSSATPGSTSSPPAAARIWPCRSPPGSSSSCRSRSSACGWPGTPSGPRTILPPPADGSRAGAHAPDDDAAADAQAARPDALHAGLGPHGEHGVE